MLILFFNILIHELKYFIEIVNYFINQNETYFFTNMEFVLL